MFHEQRNDTNRVFAALGFVDADGIGKGEFVQFAKLIGDAAPIIEPDGDGLASRTDGGDDATIAVEDFFILVVAHLKHFVASAKERAAVLLLLFV